MFQTSRIAAVLLAVGCVGLSGCAAPPKDGSTGANAATLSVKGSDTMVQLAQVWAEAFMKSHPDVRVSITGGGSNTGFTALISKGADIANASRAMKPEEAASAEKKGVAPKEFVVAKDALSIIVNKANPIQELTLAQLKDIYTAKVTNWKDLGGLDTPIVLNARESSSGTSTFFQEHVLGKGTAYAATAMLQPATSQIVAGVSQDKGAIGYVGLGYLNSTVKAVMVKKDAQSKAVAPSIETVVDGTYVLARPLFEYTNGDPTGNVKLWLDWVRGPEGQAIVKKLDFVPAQ
ncbi:MAG: PstS family phosphate ABC transporter substrate-binding protein [Armatimonadetes bacterium]|nr:PstS family phosphate ABC transporter substrate-binding protein [Armatimonadota bacterium]